jgi:hypothetical protein
MKTLKPSIETLPETITASVVLSLSQNTKQTDKEFLECFKNNLDEIAGICQRENLRSIIVVPGKMSKNDTYIVKVMKIKDYLKAPSSQNYIFIGCKKVKKVKYEKVLEAMQKPQRPYIFYFYEPENNEWYMYETNRIILGECDL